MFTATGNELNIYLRSFEFMEGLRPSQQIKIRFAKDRIAKVTNQRNIEVPLIRLEPAKIGSFFPSHGEDRLILRPEQVPPLLAEGLKAIEDRDFDGHKGFSITGILRAAWVNIRSGRRAQGGSTLTQQLVKSYFLSNERTFERKLREVAMAIILELRFSKEDLLTAYINEIFLGQNGARAIHGFGLGAQFYFNKPINELAVHEIATMISIIRGPSYYNPFRHPKRALTRRNRILNTFLDDGLISNTKHRDATDSPLGVVAGPNSGGAYYPAFMDIVRAELGKRYSVADLRSKGLRIFTTLKPRDQENAQRAVTSTLNMIEKERKLEAGILQAASVITETQTGEVLAIVGGRKGRVDGFNRALNANRTVGSVIKPVIVLTALESGLEWSTKVKDAPITMTSDSGEQWSPRNYDGKTRGELPLIRALALSLNLAIVDLGNTVGLNKVQQRFANLTGYAPKNKYPSFFLGAESMTPLQLSELYGNFASGGFHTPPKTVIAVLDEQGQPLSHYPFDLTQSISPDVVSSLNRGLEIVMSHGTGRSSQFAKSGVAGKTGTSNDNRDSWYAGFDNSKLSVIWVGRDDNKSTGLTGTSGALRIWNNLQTVSGVDPIVHNPTDDLVEIEFSTGRRAKKSCADTVVIPIRRPDTLTIKPGCGVRKTFGQRLRSIFNH
jgi:penicillin-binding protein 1B